jgi:hypothetical protein
MQKIYTLLLFLSVLSVYAQQPEEDNQRKNYYLKGKIIDGNSNDPLMGAHVINLNRVTANMSGSDGRFGIYTSVNDTLYFSYVGYQSIKLKVTKDLMKGNELEIAMYEVPEELGEVVLKPYQLVGVLEVDSKMVPVNKYERIHIAGLPQTFETGAPVATTYNRPTDAIFHPIDFLHEMFGKKPAQLRRLKKLREEDALRQMLEEKANREVLMEYLEMDVTQLNGLLDYCNYSDYFIKNASDLQVTEAVLECYENYKALNSGSTQKKRIKE